MFFNNMLDKLKYIDIVDYYIGMKMNKPYLQGINLMLMKNKILKEKKAKNNKCRMVSFIFKSSQNS